MLNETKKNNELPIELNEHDIHHYSLLYFILVIVVLMCTWYYFKTKTNVAIYFFLKILTENEKFF